MPCNVCITHVSTLLYDTKHMYCIILMNARNRVKGNHQRIPKNTKQ